MREKKDDAIVKGMGMGRKKMSRNLSRHRRQGLSKGLEAEERLR